MIRCISGTALLAIAASAAPAVTLVEAGQPKATIVVPAAATEAQRGAATLLQSYVRQSSGVELPIAAEAAAGAAVHVGRSAYVDGLGLKLDELDDDGYVLKGVDEANYVIVGPTDWGTEFGVCELLERYLGVRWLLPGEHGTDVPHLDRVELPAAEVRQQPAFFSRLLSGLRGPVQAEWARRNRMHGRVSFHHNLLHLFPPSKYFPTHPEFYPLLGGQRYQPTSDDDHHWQPNFAAPGIVDEAITNIKQFFRDNPDATSYSLGINDGRGYDESPESLARESGKDNFLGIRDVSDSYFQWANEVVTGVLQEFPDKWFGCLAYSNVAEPPSKAKVHPRIIPYMTYDRMKWLDPEINAQGHELTERWHAMSPTLGWYDYAYGSPYCLPRVYPHQMQTYLRYGRDEGVHCHYAEIYPNWGEGPKPYIYLKLQWNPDLDLEATLDDWYNRCVGPEAAPLLKEYYAIWERFWTGDAIKSAWFSKGGQYLTFSSPGYLADVKEADVRRSRQLLDDCVAKAQTDDQRARAELLREAWSYYEASALAYQAETVGRQAEVATEQDALAAVDLAAERLAYSRYRRDYVERHKDDPVLVMPLDLDRYGALAGDSWGTGLLWRLFDWIERSPAVRQRVEGLQDNPSEALRDYARTALALSAGVGELLSVNPSFADGYTGWSSWVRAKGRMVRDDQVGRTDQASVRLEGVDRGGPHQTVPIQPGRYVAVGYCKLGENVTTKGTVTMAATMRGDDNVNLPSPSTEVVPTPGEWITVVCPVTVPEKIGNVPVTRVLLVMFVNGYVEGDLVWMDDIGLYRVPDDK